MSETQTTTPESVQEEPREIKVWAFNSDPAYWIAAQTVRGAALHYASICAEERMCLPNRLLLAIVNDGDLERMELAKLVDMEEVTWDPETGVGTIADLVAKQETFPSLIAIDDFKE